VVKDSADIRVNPTERR